MGVGSILVRGYVTTLLLRYLTWQLMRKWSSIDAMIDNVSNYEKGVLKLHREPTAETLLK